MTNLTLFGGENAALTSDRFNNLNASLSLSNGYIQAPSGVYFTGGSYTVMAWVYPRAFNHFSRIIDFGNGQLSDSLVFSLSFYTTGIVTQKIYRNSNVSSLDLQSSQPLQLNQWQHVTFTFSHSSKQANISINGVLTATGTASNTPNNVIRSSNYIGKTNNVNNKNADAIYDEIKIFSVALSPIQIQFEMTNEFYLSSSVQETLQLTQVSTFYKSNRK